MKIHTFPQKSAEWFAIRQGKITGTDVGPFCLEPRKINLTIPQIQSHLDAHGIGYAKSAKKDDLIALLPDPLPLMELSGAARKLLLEKIKDNKPQDPWQIAQAEKIERQFQYMIPIQRGLALEPAARAYYERRTGFAVTEAGFVTDDLEGYGMSPDGIILPDGVTLDLHPDGTFTDITIRHGVEIKCPMPETHLLWLLDHYGKGTVPEEHLFQCQMGMVVCECEKWDFLSFCPGEAPLLVTLERSTITDQLAEGLRVLVEEKEILEQELAALWESEFGTEEQKQLLTYFNGRPMFDDEGRALDQEGNLLEAEEAP
jgi:hypothetical protein